MSVRNRYLICFVRYVGAMTISRAVGILGEYHDDIFPEDDALWVIRKLGVSPAGRGA